jgi:hypothetical protein
MTRQVLKETTAQMHVKHTEEQGHLDIAVENENVKVLSLTPLTAREKRSPKV